jgi:carboxymethylenebutenolidase
MITKDNRNLTPVQKRMVSVWEQHMAAEFQKKSLEATMATMTAEPVVNHVPVMTGGVGRKQVAQFYGTYFIPNHPRDTEIRSISRTIGHDRIVDEIIHQFTHNIPMPWILPGIPPTGKKVTVAVIVVIQFKGEKISEERIYWDQASVLTQIGLLDPKRLPVVGKEEADKVLDPSDQPSNKLIEQADQRG